MANHSSDRQRMRNDFRELARLAKPGSDSPVHGFDTADSSGYVDLSAFSTSDAGWVDRELARARKGAPPPRPRGGGRAIDVLTPASMAPVSLEVAGEPEDTMNVRPSRARRALYTTMGLAAVAAVGLLAFTLARHPPPPPAEAQATTATTAAAAVAPPAVDVPTPPPAVTSAAATTPTAAAIAATPTTPAPATLATTTSKAKKKTFVASRAHAVAQAPAAAAARAAALPTVVIPKAKPSSGSDSLMDLIKKSVATGK